MVFAVNPVQSSPRNFTAFQQLAAQLNGTNTTGAASAPSPSPSGSGATTFGVSAALAMGSLFAAVALVL